MARRCSADVPQQPPTIAAPASTARRAYSAIRSGVPEYTMSEPRNRGTPQLPFEIRFRSPFPSAIANSVTRMSDAPTPQFAPIASGGGSIPANTSAKPAGCRPIMVRPAVSNDPVAVYGIPTAIARARGGAELLGRRHGLDPRDVGAPGRQAGDLLGEHFECVVVGECAERGEQLAGRPDRARDDHRARRGVGNLTRELGGPLVELEDAILGAVQLQAVAVAAERVRQDDVGAGVDEGAVQLLDALGMLDVPELGRLPRLEPHLEVVRTGGTVGEHHPSRRQECFEGAAHGREAMPPGPPPWPEVRSTSTRSATASVPDARVGRPVRRAAVVRGPPGSKVGAREAPRRRWSMRRSRTG